MTRLQAKVALVSGGSRGIGRAIAERLGRDAEAVAATIRAAGVRALALQSDLSQVHHTRNLFATVLEQFGRLDIVVNNVGVSMFKPTTEIEEDGYDRVMNTNARGTFFALQEAARHVAADVYAASKAAVEQFGMARSKELGPRGITVNQISPGVTDTDGLVMPA
jgi:3-oxoacyl-[acyl-carrier protein] reductase